MIKLVDVGAQNRELSAELEQATAEVVRSSAFIGGSHVREFESAFAEFSGNRYAVGVANGTSALELALKASGVGPGHEVITVANTFFATVEAIYNVGAVPVFVDVNESDGLIDVAQVEEKVNPRTRALLPVHLFGHLADIPSLKAICDKHDLILIEDAAQAHGASSDWGQAGALSNAATFSFYPGKNLGAWGDAGAVVTMSKELSDHVRKLRDHGRLSKYEHDLIGTNARIDALQAAVLQTKLKKLTEWNSRRRNIAATYTESFREHGFRPVWESGSYQSAWHLFVVRVANRDDVQEWLKSQEIETGIHYPVPLHRQPALAENFRSTHLPVTDRLAREIISLPMHPHLTEAEVAKVVEEFLKVAVRVEAVEVENV